MLTMQPFSFRVVPITRARRSRGHEPADADSRFAEALELAIKRLGTVVAVAEICGVTRSAVYQWRSGQTANLRQENYFAVCQAADLDPRWVATGEGDPSPYAYPEADVRFLRRLLHLTPKQRRDLDEYLAFTVSRPTN